MLVRATLTLMQVPATGVMYVAASADCTCKGECAQTSQTFDTCFKAKGIHHDSSPKEPEPSTLTKQHTQSFH
jgi:hypothetical protein